MLYYPNYQIGVALQIGLENGYEGSITDFKQSLTFTVNEDTLVTYIKLFISKGHCLNGHMLMPKLYKKGTDTNLIPDAWKENYSSSGVVMINNLRFGRWQTYSYSRGLMVWPLIKQGSKYVDKVDPKGANVDTEHFFVNTTSNLVLSPGTYVLCDHSHNNKHWDVCFGTKSVNGNAFRPNGKFPKLHNKMYYEDEGGFIWEKKTEKERYWIGYSTHCPVEIMKKDYTIICDPHFSYTFKTKDSQGNTYKHTDQAFGPMGIRQTKDFFFKFHGRPGNKCPVFLFLTSKDLKDWVATEVPIRNNLFSGYCIVSRNNNKFWYLVADVSSPTNATKIRMFEIDSDGHVIDKGEKDLPSNCRGTGSGNQWGGKPFIRHGAFIYTPTGDYLPYDEPGAVMKPYYGIDIDGNMFNTHIPRWYASGTGGRAFSLGNLVYGFKEDAIYMTYTQKVDNVYIYHTHIVTSTDGFKTLHTVGPLPVPNYTLYKIYDVPKYGIRASFYRTDLSMNERVYDVYDKDGNLLAYTVAEDSTNGSTHISPIYEIPVVCWNEGIQAGQRGVNANGNAVFNWRPNQYSTGDLIYTEGEGPAPPDVLNAEINDSGFLSGYVLQAMVNIDNIGRPVQTSDNKGVAVFISTARNIGYVEDAMHRGKHFSSKLAMLEQ